jgi:hypothetical protein
MLGKLTEFLNLSTMSLGTRGRTGRSHIAPVYFVSDGNRYLIFFLSSRVNISGMLMT